MSELRIEMDSSSVDWNDVRKLFLSVGWQDRPPEDIRAAFGRSTHQLFIFDDRQLVACGRTVDDGRYYALICDLVVAPRYQGQGIGSRILSELLARCSGFEFVTLTAAEGKDGFYLNQGWRRQTSSFIWPRDEQQARIHAEE